MSRVMVLLNPKDWMIVGKKLPTVPLFNQHGTWFTSRPDVHCLSLATAHSIEFVSWLT